MLPSFRALKGIQRVADQAFSVTQSPPLPNHLNKPAYASKPDGKPIRPRKYGHVWGDHEIDKIRKACRVASQARALALEVSQPGSSTDEVDSQVENFIISQGAYPVGRNFHGFPKALCASPNEVVVHGIPNTRVLRQGDIINYDIAVYLDGFYGDNSGMSLVGQCADRHIRLVQVTRQAVDLAIQKFCRPGVRLNEIGQFIEDFAKSHGFQVIPDFCGHFIGEELHMSPNVSPVSNTEDLLLKPGMTFTIEPILCEGSTEFFFWPDGWTAETRDGGFTAQHEETILITEDGCEVLTRPLEYFCV